MRIDTNSMIKAALFLAISIILPFVFHITGIGGTIFLPMHIPVLVCGFLLGPCYGSVTGFIAPFLNSILTGMPSIFPTAVAMAFELAAYGFLSGFFYKKKRLNIFISLILSMLIGRFILGVVNYIILFAQGNVFVLKVFLVSVFINSIWGIVIQLVLIPFIIRICESNSKLN